MKNIKHYIMLAATLLVASCSQDEELNVPTVCPVEGELVEITVGAPQEQNSRVSYDDSATPFAWEAGDELIVVGFGADGTYKGQEVFSMKGEPAGDKKTATFVGKLTGGANYKLYYQAAKLTISTSDGTPSINYSAQTEDVANPTAHMKNFYLLGTEAISLADMLDASKAKTLSLQNSLLRIYVKSFPTIAGDISSIVLTTNTQSNSPKESTLKISNVPTDKAFVVYLMFDPATMAQQQGNNFTVRFNGATYDFYTTAIKTAATLDKAGRRYKLTLANYEHELNGGKGLFKWAPVIKGNEMWLESPDISDNMTKYGFEPLGSSNFLRKQSDTPITTFESNLLSQNVSLQGVYMPNTITTFPDYAFMECTDLKQIEMPTQLTNMGTGTFKGCYNLTEIVIPKGVKEIKESCFSGCTKLTNVLLHDDITNIMDRAFEICPLNLSTLPANLTAIGEKAFTDIASTSLTIPAKVETLGAYFLGGDNLTELHLLCPSADKFNKEAFAAVPADNITLYLHPNLFNLVKGKTFFGCTWKDILPIGDVNNNGVGFDDIIKDDGNMY